MTNCKTSGSLDNSPKGSTIPEIIPPRSVVELVKPDRTMSGWTEIGKRYRVGYYSKYDGLGTLWLVNDEGMYCQSTCRAYLLDYFKIIRLSRETDYFGENKRRLGALKKPTGKTKTLSQALQKKHRKPGAPQQAASGVPALPEIIPPRSVVELVKADRRTPEWRGRLGTRYRVGYYSMQDGVGTIWLVDDEGIYRETTDREYLLKYFKIIRLSQEMDYFGENKRRLGALKKPTGEKVQGRTLRRKK